MDTISNKQTKGLNRLITTLYDGENGYKEAAEEVDSVSLATKFRELSQQRYNFGHEIKPFITKLGGKVDKGGSTGAALHRAWIDIKSALATQDEAAVLQECIRGDESAIETYRDVLTDTSYSSDVRQVITRQLETFERTVAELKQLKQTYKNV
ncbi:ferritin-like domain-containing protein [Neolewinella litorea]|uniref:PA2169 family four-helix-bundle protein n=1 Tax=Neolewinella litorea TaxID=2562452 RepID=A0A4S4NPQ8_9BACT|nr:PA2169 family four-helix-bundle protein [Neolewinella litorea]THH42039.1 PA2169 family four-helix-bundle protein [Neolewinella litorea]